MPNWCENDMFIHGRKEDVEAFMKFAGGGENAALYFGQFVPYPEQYARLDKNWAFREAMGGIADSLKLPEIKDGYNMGGYDWCVTNWNTKWDASDVRVRTTGRGATYNFNTAWAPPVAVVVAMSKRFPTLKFTIKYYEASNAFKGTAVCKGGEVLKRHDEHYSGGRGG